jgi:hypothetical protein
MNNILSFIEKIIIEYDLEKEFIDNDADLKNVLSKAEDISDRVFLKFLYSSKITNYEKQNLPLDVPSMKLKGIIENLINKKISPNELSSVIEKNLEISKDVSEKIAKEINENKEIIEEINSIKPSQEENHPIEDDQKEVPKNNTKSIGFELLK